MTQAKFNLSNPFADQELHEVLTMITELYQSARNKLLEKYPSADLRLQIIELPLYEQGEEIRFQKINIDDDSFFIGPKDKFSGLAYSEKEIKGFFPIITVQFNKI